MAGFSEIAENSENIHRHCALCPRPVLKIDELLRGSLVIVSTLVLHRGTDSKLYNMAPAKCRSKNHGERKKTNRANEAVGDDNLRYANERRLDPGHKRRFEQTKQA